MIDWFEWNGARCTAYGVRVLEQPPITAPAARVVFTDIPGRNGSLTTLQGEDVYDDMILTTQCIISDPARIPTLCAWLRGAGKVAFANRPGGFYYARIINQISFEKILRGNPHRSFAINFRCKPFWYQHPSPAPVVITTPTVITNPGAVASDPVITVYGSGDAALLVGGKTLQIAGLSGEITIDSEARLAYKKNGDLLTLLTGMLSGDWPTMRPGLVPVSWSGSIQKVEIQGNWRSL